MANAQKTDEPTILIDPRYPFDIKKEHLGLYIHWARNMHRVFGKISVNFMECDAEFRWSGKTIAILCGDTKNDIKFFVLSVVRSTPRSQKIVNAVDMWEEVFKQGLHNAMGDERDAASKNLNLLHDQKSSFLFNNL